MNSTDSNNGLAPEWDELLGDGLVRAPTDFQARVMQQVRIDQLDTVNTKSTRSWIGSLGSLLEVVAVLIAAIIAGWQTLAFMFGLWATAIAI